MKKLLVLFMIIVFICSLVGCNTQSEIEEVETENSYFESEEELDVDDEVELQDESVDEEEPMELLNLNDTLLIDWYESFDNEPIEFLGMYENTFYVIVKSVFYDAILCSYDCETKEVQEIAKYFDLDRDYNFAEGYIIFYACTDEKGNNLEFMSYDCEDKNLVICSEPEFSFLNKGYGMDYLTLFNYEVFMIPLNDKIILRNPELGFHAYFDLKTGEVNSLSTSMLTNLSFEDGYFSGEYYVGNFSFMTYDPHNMDCFYYTYFTNSTFMIYRYNLSTNEDEQIYCEEYSSGYNSIAIVNDTIFLADDSAIYLVSENTATKIYLDNYSVLNPGNIMPLEWSYGSGTVFKENSTDILILKEDGTIIDIVEFLGNDDVVIKDINDYDYVLDGIIQNENSVQVDGYFYFDYFEQGDDSGVVISCIPVPKEAEYLYCKSESSDEETIFTSYFYIEQEDFENMNSYGLEYFENNFTELKTGVYEIPSNYYIMFFNSMGDYSSESSDSIDNTVVETDEIVITETIKDILNSTFIELYPSDCPELLFERNGGVAFMYQDFVLEFPISEPQEPVYLTADITCLLSGQDSYTYQELQEILGDVLKTDYNYADCAFVLSMEIDGYTLTFGQSYETYYDNLDDAVITQFRIKNN